MWTRLTAVISILAAAGCDEPRVHNPPGYAVIYQAITLPGGNLIAVGRRPGDAGAVLHYDGSAWHLLDGGALPEVRSVWATSPESIWVTSRNEAGAKVRHWDGSTWRELDEEILGAGIDFSAAGHVWGSSDDDVWLFGAATEGAPSSLYHWDGTRWEINEVPRPVDLADEYAFGVHGPGCSPAPDEVWTFGDSDNGDFSFMDWSVHWNGEIWSHTLEPGLAARVACRGTVRWASGGQEDFSYLYRGASAGWTLVGMSHEVRFRDIAIEDDDHVRVLSVDATGPVVWRIEADARNVEPAELTNLLPAGSLEGTPTALAMETDGTMWVFDDQGTILEVP